MLNFKLLEKKNRAMKQKLFMIVFSVLLLIVLGLSYGNERDCPDGWTYVPDGYEYHGETKHCLGPVFEEDNRCYWQQYKCYCDANEYCSFGQYCLNQKCVSEENVFNIGDKIKLNINTNPDKDVEILITEKGPILRLLHDEQDIVDSKKVYKEGDSLRIAVNYKGHLFSLYFKDGVFHKVIEKVNFGFLISVDEDKDGKLLCGDRYIYEYNNGDPQDYKRYIIVFKQGKDKCEVKGFYRDDKEGGGGETSWYYDPGDKPVSINDDSNLRELKQKFYSYDFVDVTNDVAAMLFELDDNREVIRNIPTETTETTEPGAPKEIEGKKKVYLCKNAVDDSDICTIYLNICKDEEYENSYNSFEECLEARVGREKAKFYFYFVKDVNWEDDDEFREFSKKSFEYLKDVLKRSDPEAYDLFSQKIEAKYITDLDVDCAELKKARDKKTLLRYISYHEDDIDNLPSQRIPYKVICVKDTFYKEYINPNEPYYGEPDCETYVIGTTWLYSSVIFISRRHPDPFKSQVEHIDTLAHEFGHSMGFCDEYAWKTYRDSDISMSGLLWHIGCPNEFPPCCERVFFPYENYIKNVNAEMIKKIKEFKKYGFNCVASQDFDPNPDFPYRCDHNMKCGVYHIDPYCAGYPFGKPEEKIRSIMGIGKVRLDPEYIIVYPTPIVPSEQGKKGTTLANYVRLKGIGVFG